MAGAGSTSAQPDLMKPQVEVEESDSVDGQRYSVGGSDADSDSPGDGGYYFGHVGRHRHMQMGAQ